MKQPTELNTVSETINQVLKNGYSEEFKIKGDKFCIKSGEEFKPEDLTIIKVHRFEGISDPGDMSILYVIETRSGTKGYFLDAFGTYADQDSQKIAEMFKKVKIIKDH
jgi:hypothetical protein